MPTVEDRLDMRKPRVSKRKRRIELDRLFIKLLRFFQIGLSLFITGEEIVRLYVKKISFVILGRTALEPRSFSR